jgi:hypothetical protein
VAAPLDDAYLVAHSGLPGPRANLTLAQDAADSASVATARRWLASSHEYLALCGAIAIGRHIASGRTELWPQLKTAANDARWRVREGVAMGLQRIEPHTMLREVWTWVDGTALEQRAADPAHGVSAFLKLADSDDPDLQWIVRENRKKKRLPAECR